MNELALFAGAGGGLLASRLLGWTTVCAVEINDYCRRVLMQRQDDGILEPFPIWDDICTFDGLPWRGKIDILSGGFPCQDISSAGAGAGINGKRSGLWSEMARIVREVGPNYVFVENSPMLTSRGLNRVLGDLAALGFDAEWGCISAADAIWSCGTPAVYHDRNRIWIVAKSCDTDNEKQRDVRGVSERGADSHRACAEGSYAHGLWQLQPQGGIQDIGGWTGNMGERESNQGSNTNSIRRRQMGQKNCRAKEIDQVNNPHLQCLANWWEIEPSVGRVADGIPNRVDRLRAIGNGQVPAVAAAAFRILEGRHS